MLQDSQDGWAGNLNNSVDTSRLMVSVNGKLEPLSLGWRSAGFPRSDLC